MSEPVSNSEIEDVLSSIRRLVSDEPLKRSEPDPDEIAKVERLVLTPAFRVPDENLEVVVEDATDASSSEPVADEPQPVSLEIVESHDSDEHLDAHENEIAPLADDALIAQIPEGFEANEDWHDEKLTLVANAPKQEIVETAAEPDAPKANSENDHTTGEQSLESRLAELEAAIQHAPQEWEPDGSEEILDDETTPISAEIEPAERIDDVLEAAATDDTNEVAELDPVETVVLAAAVMTAVEEDPETPAETMVQASIEADETPEEWVDSDVTVELESVDTDTSHEEVAAEPEMIEAEPVVIVNDDDQESAEFDDIETAEQHRDQTSGDDMIDLETQISEQSEEISADDATENLMADDAAMLDEDALRDMIGDLVRQELQGVLGERITRNVRRLVRREIQRAMAMRDLE